MSEYSDLVTYIWENYTGFMRFARLLRLVERIGRNTPLDKDKNAREFIHSTLFMIYEMGMKEKIYGVWEDAVSLAEALGIPAEETGMNIESIQQNMENFKSKVDAKRLEIEKAKKSQNKDLVKHEYFNLGELYYSNGQMGKAAEAYRISYCFSINTEDLVKISIKLGTVSIYNQNYSFGLKFVKEAMYKTLESQTSQENINLLNTIQALLYLGNGNLKDVAHCLWENQTSSSSEISHLTSEKDMAFYAIMSGLMAYNRKVFKDYYYSKPNFRILTENFPGLLDLGSTYINFDFEEYFKLLNSFQSEFKHDYYLYPQMGMIMQKCKKVMITYITPYKTVNLKDMADSFGMSLEETERAVEDLIVKGEIKYKINKYNKSLTAKKEDYKLENFKKAVQIGDEFIRGMESMLLKHHLRKKSFKA